MFVVHCDDVLASGRGLMETTPLLAGLPMEASTEDRLAAIGDRAPGGDANKVGYGGKLADLRRPQP